jgi:serine/threonine protein phosphatase PrpC
MGNFLEVPILTSIVATEKYGKINIYFYSVQGYRKNMEDFFSLYKDKKYIYVGVYDGHGGDNVSHYIKENFLKYLSHCIDNTKISPSEFKKNVKIINKCFISFDMKIKNNIINSKNQGSTVVCAIISKEYIMICHCGDSRAIAYNGRDIIFSTIDYKPCNSKEKKRILKSGHVLKNNRIDGQIDISRCLGDFHFKQSYNYNNNAIISLPGIHILNINQCKFLVLVSDGITNKINNKQLCDYIEYNLQINVPATDISDNIAKYCLYKEGTDNMTICIVIFYKYDFNNSLFNIEKEELDIIHDRVVKVIKKNRDNYMPYSIFNLLNLIKSVDYNLKISAGFRYNYINDIYKSFLIHKYIG